MYSRTPSQLTDCSHSPVISDRFVGAAWNAHPAAKGQLTAKVLTTYRSLPLSGSDETELVTLLPESLGRRVASSADIVLLEPDMPITPLRQSMYWHARRDRDPGHAWLGDQIQAVSHP